MIKFANIHYVPNIDANEIAKIISKITDKEPYLNYKEPKWILSSRRIFIIAYFIDDDNNTKIVGFGGFDIKGHFFTTYVYPEYRHLGIYFGLYRVRTNILKELGCKRIYAWCKKDNVRMNEIYKKTGWKEDRSTERSIRYYKDISREM